MSFMKNVTARLDVIDVQVEKVQRLIEGGASLDPEMASGLATTEPMPSVQRKLDQCAAAVESLERRLQITRVS